MDRIEERLVSLASEGIIKFKSLKWYHATLEYCIRREDKRISSVIKNVSYYKDFGIRYRGEALINLYLLIRKTSLMFREFISPLLDHQFQKYENLKMCILFDKPCEKEWKIIRAALDFNDTEYYEMLVKIATNCPNIKKELLNKFCLIQHLQNTGQLYEFREHYMEIYEAHGPNTPVEVLEELFKPPDGELHLLGQKRLEEYNTLTDNQD